MTALLSVAEAAKALHISRSMVYKLVADGRTPHFRIGTKVLFSEEHLRRFLADSEQGGAA